MPPRKAQQTWYHGGRRVHDWSALVWDRDRTTASPNAEGPGMYWTTDLDEAARYVDHTRDPVIYAATVKPGFKFATGRPRMDVLMTLYGCASEDDQAVFLSNWGFEHPALPAVVQQALRAYTHQDTLLNAAATLYHDLFRYDDNAYVTAMRDCAGFDGVVIPKGTTGGSKRRDHLVLWNIRAVDLFEVG